VKVPFKITHFAASDIGLERDQNQDSYGSGSNSNGSIFIVADGLGHSIGGKFASQTAVEYLLNAFTRTNPADINEFLQYTLNDINRLVFREKVKKYNKEMMASTCVVLIIQEGKAYLANVGDSRAYFWHTQQLTQLSKDQSLVQSLLDNGMLTAKEAVDHVAKNVVTQALGTDGKLEIDLMEEPILPSSGDKFLICTDGLWGMVTDDKISKILGQQSGQNAVNQMITAAKNNGGIDNITLQLIEIE
jgi:protein phosphatase